MHLRFAVLFSVLAAAPALGEDAPVRPPPTFRFFAAATKSDVPGDPGDLSATGRVDVSARPVEDFETSLGASLAAPGGVGSIEVSARWIPHGWGAEDGVRATLMPIDTYRIALGFDPSLQLVRSFPARGIHPAALLVDVRRGLFSAWLATKSVPMQNELSRDLERYFGFFGGGAVGFRRWELDVEGAYLPLGVVPGLAMQGIRVDAWTAGAAARLTYRTAGPIGSPTDLERLRMAPFPYERLFDPPARGVTGLELSMEGVWAAQALEDPDAFPKAKVQPVWGAQARATGELGRARVQLGGRIASATLVQADVPGFPSYKAFPGAAEQVPVIWGDVSADYQMGRWPLRPGVLVRVFRFAGFRTPLTLSGMNLPAGLTDYRWVVLRSTNSVSILPQGAEIWPGMSASATLRWDPLPNLSAFADLTWVYDPNKTTFANDLTGVAEPTFVPPNSVRGDLVLQFAM